MDSIDVQICRLLQQNSRLHLSAIAEQIGISIATVSDRIRKLEERSIIRHYTTDIDPKAYGCDITAFIFVTVEGSQHYANFIAQCQRHPEILECHAITGEASHLLKVRTGNTASLERLLAAIQKWKGVKRTLTSLVLSTHKETLVLPTRFVNVQQ